MTLRQNLREATLAGVGELNVPTVREPATRPTERLAPAIDDIRVSPGVRSAWSSAGTVASAFADHLLTWFAVVQAALRRPSSLAIDCLLALAAVAIIRGAAPSGIIAAALFVAGGLLFGLWKTRSCVEAYGSAWYAKALVAPLVAAGTESVVVRALSVTEAEEWVLVAFGLLAGFHLLIWLTLAFARRRGRGFARALVVGQPDDTTAVARRLEIYPEMGLATAGTCNPADDLVAGAAGEEHVERMLRTWAPTHVLCVDSDGTQEIFKDLVAFGQGRIDLTLVTPASRMTGATRRLGDLGLVPVKMRRAWGSGGAKRIFDVTVAALALVISSPVLAATALAIRLEDHGPIIFKQRRPGRDDEPFEIYKFRSMVTVPEPSSGYLSKRDTGRLTFKVAEDPRVTRVGRVIRRLSIDELPQLFNVLKGNMSLVGPRPLAFDPGVYEGRARRRHLVRPGITGLWQVSGANALNDTDMIELDLNYVANHSLGLDLLLLLRTASAVLIRRAPV
jgi:lipopolysaccharide/colanic/teichoic acid biosynthesis glycosyltransferase